MAEGKSKIWKRLGFVPRRTVQDAVRDLVTAFQAGKLPNPLDDIKYYNVKALLAANLS